MVDGYEVPHRRLPGQSCAEGGCGPDGHTGGGWVPVPAMGSGYVQSRKDSAGAPDSGSCPPDSAAVAELDRSSQRDRSLPFPSAAEVDGQHGFGCDPLDSRDPKPHSGSAGSLCLGGETDPQRLHALGGVNSEALQVRAVPSSHGGGQNDSGIVRPVSAKILSLQLANPHQHSYAHAILHSIVWTASNMQEGLRIWRQDLRKFLQWLSNQSKPQPPWQNLAWQALTQPWSTPLRHHDHELFMQYLQPMIFAPGEGIWQSRATISSSNKPVCQASQSGHVWPMSLPAALDPDTPFSLQQLVTQWHSQAQVHGLSALSPALALRIPRVDDRGNNHHPPLKDEWRLTIPFFPHDGLETHHIPYEVCGIILGSEGTESQGQYCAVLLEEGTLKYLTSDGKRAVRVKTRERSQMCQRAYIAILKQSVASQSSF